MEKSALLQQKLRIFTWGAKKSKSHPLRDFLSRLRFAPLEMTGERTKQLDKLEVINQIIVGADAHIRPHTADVGTPVPGNVT